MKKILLSTIATITLLSAASAELTTKEVEYKFIQNVIPGTAISKYKKSIIDGFYNVYLANGQLIYVNPYKEIIFYGEVLNKNGYNLTAGDRSKWHEELNAKAVKNTSADKLVKHAKKIDFGKGSQNEYSYVVFTNPMCPHCAVLEDFFETQNVTAYINFIPRVRNKKANELSLKALSSKDFLKTMKDIKSGIVPLVTISDKTKKQLKDMQALGNELKVNGTPTIYVVDLKKQIIVDIIKGANIPKLKKFIK